jgi:hypothetical protein
MKEEKLKQLFAAAREDVAAEPSEHFAEQVLHAIRRPVNVPAVTTWLEQINLVFPRLIAAAIVVIIAAAAVGFWAGGDLAAQVADASEQLLLPMDWL